MKNIKVFNLLICTLFSFTALTANGYKSNFEKTKDIVEEFDVNTDSQVYFKHRRGKLNVKYTSGTKGRVEAHVVVKGDILEDINLVLKTIKIGITPEGNNININTSENVKSWSQTSNFFWSSYELTLKDGTKIKSKIEEITITATLYLPCVSLLSLSSKYDDIHIEECKSNILQIDLHSGNLTSELIEADTEVKIKYGKLNIQQANKLSITSHDSKITSGNIGDVIINDKYSDLSLGNLMSLDGTFHDSDLSMGNIGGPTKIQDKYSSFVIGNMQDVNLKLHDSDITCGIAINVNAQTKYSDVEFQSADKLTINSHDDDITMGTLKELVVDNSKYSSYTISRLESKGHIAASHDDHYSIKTSGDKFHYLSIDGKYVSMDFPLPVGINYKISAEMKYGHIKHPVAGLSETKITKTNDNVDEIIGIAKGNNGSEIGVTIKCHDCNIDLRN